MAFSKRSLADKPPATAKLDAVSHRDAAWLILTTGVTRTPVGEIRINSLEPLFPGLSVRTVMPNQE
ncbi:MAG: hypothetical protein GTO53_03860 [Planctomycetales bacterium]|nr:hypothetical protein [Planctomycetales bacterium]NIM08297.1 hypothetical protein [Planctomycetales bacterium]NIN08563.1 hypothetical protein [Planctomycetales bacterium]NIN76908.1 hypothetical protein [Planctomycetales bacterium]NIO34861.1 hypothetical protein [Planctomycetales bacterium]